MVWVTVPPSSFRFIGGAHFLREIDSLLEEGGDKERIDRGWRRRMSHGNSENALNKIIIDSVRVSEHNRSCCVWAHADSPWSRLGSAHSPHWWSRVLWGNPGRWEHWASCKEFIIKYRVSNDHWFGRPTDFKIRVDFEIVVSQLVNHGHLTHSSLYRRIYPCNELWH